MALDYTSFAIIKLDFDLRIMRSDDSTRDTCHTAHKDHPPPSLPLHIRNAQLREQVRRTTINAPSLLEVVNRHISDGLHAGMATGGTGIVDEYRGWTELAYDVGVKRANLDL
jgi:hypothetical protein